MITRNEALLSELNKSLENIKNKLKQQRITAYDMEIHKVDNLLQQAAVFAKSNTSLEKNQIIKCIMQITSKIDADISSVELEMHGISNYTVAAKQQLQIVVFKQQIKDDLNRLMRYLINSRQEPKNSKLSSIARLLV